MSIDVKDSAAVSEQQIRQLVDLFYGLQDWLVLNAEYASAWPNITVKRDPPADAKAFDGEKDKFARYFSPNPGQGDI